MSGTPEDRRIGSDPRRQGLLYVLSEALEKFSRLQQILKRQQIFIKVEHAEAKSATAVDKLINYLEAHCQMFLGNSDRVSRLLRGKPLNEAEERAVIQALGILIVHTLQIHELLLLLPREVAKPQASFLLRNCFGRSDLKASIVLTNQFSAYEYRFEDILEKVNVEQEERMALTHGGNVLCQAFGDKDSPLAWAVLAHEYGHVLDDQDQISKGIVRAGAGEEVARQGAPDLGAAVVAETVADFIAAHVLGAASLLPILFVEMMQPRLGVRQGMSAGHPPTPLRVKLVCEYLSQLGVSTADFESVFEAYKLDYERKVKGMDAGQRKGLETMEQQAQKLLSPLTGTIASRVNALDLQRFGVQNIERARLLQEALAAKQPISSRRSQSDTEAYSALDSLECGTTTPEQAYKVLAGLDEVPVLGSEIVTAGWLYRLSTFEEELMKTFPEEPGRRANLEIYGKCVEKTDALLLKSLEAADVHAEILRRLALA